MHSPHLKTGELCSISLRIKYSISTQIIWNSSARDRSGGQKVGMGKDSEMDSCPHLQKIWLFFLLLYI